MSFSLFLDEPHQSFLRESSRCRFRSVSYSISLLFGDSPGGDDERKRERGRGDNSRSRNYAEHGLLQVLSLTPLSRFSFQISHNLKYTLWRKDKVVWIVDRERTEQ